jgi:hypothetical protein
LAFLKSPTDKTVTLMHVLAETVRRHFADLLTFEEELKFAEKASASRA